MKVLVGQGSKLLIAHKGRASYLKERSIGYLDPGAASCCFFINTISSDFYTKTKDKKYVIGL